MTTRIVTTIITACCFNLCVAAGVVLAAAGFQCATCHRTPDKLLPAKHVKKSDFSTCFSCHSIGRPAPDLMVKLHRNHLHSDTNADACLNCHPSGADGSMQLDATGQRQIKKADISDLAQKMSTWLQSDKLAYAHQRKGISCRACHTAYAEDDPYAEKCIGCHGDYEVMAKKTAQTKLERNPHKSHYPTLKCTNCHQSHDDFKNFCATCHGFAFGWKMKK